MDYPSFVEIVWEKGLIMEQYEAFLKMVDILGNERRAGVWFLTPQEAFDMRTPLEECQTQEGEQRVLDEVERIEGGVY
jgi:uncharacterized protein (DUF2384 family)